MENTATTFVVLIGICFGLRLFLRWRESSWKSEAEKGAAKEAGTSDVGLSRFQMGWLGVYYAVMMADWLQGPYVYALYREYGFEKAQIAHLFIAGYVSSMLFGTVAGSLADKLGRRWGCLCFGVCYSLSCLTKLSGSFSVLMAGRLLGGVGTSLLFSVFEAWMIHEHKERRFSEGGLSSTFSMATFGNGIVAIVAGVAASFLVDSTGSLVSPFLLSMVILLAVTAYVALSWGENYGDSQIQFSATLSSALKDISASSRVPVLGAVQALFEASMYIFVFMWTPALEATLPPGATISHGLVFASFMVSTMIGSSLFSFLVGFLSPELIGLLTLLSSAVALSTPVYSSFRYIPFLVFEVCCGLYWPCFGTLRGQYLPERSRSTIMNFFRVPLNLLVVLVLVRVDILSEESVFLVITAQLSLAVCLQVFLFLKSSVSSN